jgi:bifunctional enzyme CysN/CysC
MVNGATFQVGDEVTLLPAGLTTTIQGIRGPSGALDAAAPGLSIDLDLASDTDAGRGDLLATAPLPQTLKEFDATICWFGEQPLAAGSRLRLKHTTRSTPVMVKSLKGSVDVGTLQVSEATALTMNDIGLAELMTADPIVADDYRVNRVTGSFVLIDERTNATVAAGMIGHADFL